MPLLAETGHKVEDRIDDTPRQIATERCDPATLKEHVTVRIIISPNRSSEILSIGSRCPSTLMTGLAHESRFWDRIDADGGLCELLDRDFHVGWIDCLITLENLRSSTIAKELLDFCGNIR